MIRHLVLMKLDPTEDAGKLAALKSEIQKRVFRLKEEVPGAVSVAFHSNLNEAAAFISRACAELSAFDYEF